MKPYQLDRTYRIVADPHCLVLEHLKKAGTEGMRWQPIGWYQGWQELLRGYARLKSRKSRKGAVQAIEEAVRYAQSHLTPLKDKYGDIL